MSPTPHLTGWAHSRFGRSELPDVEALMAEVSLAAVCDAGLEPADVDAVSVGVFGTDTTRQRFDAALVGTGAPELAGTRAVRSENACATGSAALYAALDMVEAGRARAVLVVGAEKMTRTPGPEVTETLLGAAYLPVEGEFGSFPAVFAWLAARYAERYGDPRETLSRIAAKNHRNGVANPFAHLRRDLGLEFCSTVSERNPVVADPLLRTDCSMVSDGAAAVVVSSPDLAAGARRAVRVRARVQANDPMPIVSRPDPLALAGAGRAFRAALAEAGAGLDDLDLIETHDCFTVAEMLQYEAFGLAEPGKASTVLTEGRTEPGGVLPVNVSGGLKAKGHPIGATGVSQHVLAAMQLVGEAGDMQLPRAERAAVFNMGGAAVANYATVLEGTR
ncbi:MULTISPECIES: thiolase domain-containing protein [Pseudonocardia]|uniref:Acetyl-CoA acetyltransferase n=2 Tax=Pseudonocardia TaxID=1847 RepID=A0A1Y2MMS2_PSEAH|nr:MULTISPECIES: thiolase domain-containing protein [Pseudonocardia]OSY36289.1 acetyl-CoA acetyltransferase [Pseudonocardia autotrophica]TDN73094.1 acetyl-CoA C-acetyltransferase [Pseudonocardia autotrophica]BBG03814.1 acetyl-CoA acetyltransferase [Pseudonocardia autotrophica]GEC26578.1 acetyl-CoA acetyltransferase [Pseudonocardia saturnea]